MPQDVTLAELLDRYIKRVKSGNSLLANAIMARFPEFGGVSLTNIKNWRSGISGRITDWRQLLQVAAVLDLSIEETNHLLTLCRHGTLEKLQTEAMPKEVPLLAHWFKSENGQAVLKMPGPPPGSILPYAPNRLFTGREEEMAALTAVLTKPTPERPVATAVLSGIGGVGKSQLAVEFAYRLGHEFSGGVYWIDFTNPQDVDSRIADLGGADGMNLRPNFNELELDEQTKLVRRAWQEHVPRLLIFDNCEEETLLEQYRPNIGGCRVLVTSRRAEWNPQLGLHRVPLQGLLRPESIQLLGSFRADFIHEEADKLAELVGDLPLGLVVAGQSLAETQYDLTIGDFLVELQKKEGESLLDLPFFRLFTSHYSPTGHELNLIRTFEFSYRQLNTAVPTDQQASQLLTFTAVLAAGVIIPRDLLKAQFTTFQQHPAALSAALHRLKQLGLITENRQGNILLHQLIAEFIYHKATQQALEVSQLATEKAVLQTIAPILEIEEDFKLRSWEPHLRTLVERAKQREDSEAVALAQQFGLYLRLNGRYPTARDIFLWTLTTSQKQTPKDPPAIAKSQQQLGLIYLHLSQLNEAKTWLEEVLAEHRAIWASPSPIIAETLNYLAMTLQSLGKYQEAFKTIDEAAQMLLKTVGENHLSTATAINNRGHLYHVTDNNEQALSDLRKATNIRKRLLPFNNRIVAEGINNIALVQAGLGQAEEALKTISDAIQIWEQTLEPNHPDLAKAYGNRGYFHYLLGQFDKAEDYNKKAIAISEQVLGETHESTVISYNNFGVLLVKMERFALGKQYLEKALHLWTETKGKDSPETSYGFHNMGRYYLATHEFDSARRSFEQAVTLRLKHFGEGHSLVHESREALSQLDNQI